MSWCVETSLSASTQLSDVTDASDDPTNRGVSKQIIGTAGIIFLWIYHRFKAESIMGWSLPLS